MSSSEQPRFRSAKHIVATGLDLVEDLVYVGLGILLAAAAVWLLFSAMWSFGADLLANTLGAQLIHLLDQMLLVLLIIELLYTVQVSFREHSLTVEPFLVVALIASIRKILVLTAELPDQSETAFRHMIWELSLLTLMVVIFVTSLILLQRHARAAGYGRNGEHGAST